MHRHEKNSVEEKNFASQRISFSDDGAVLQVEYPEEPVYLRFASLEVTDNPALPFSPSDSTPFPISLDENSLCVKNNSLTFHICWLPDYFVPTTPVAQHGNHVCIGGEDGMMAFIHLDGFTIPDL